MARQVSARLSLRPPIPPTIKNVVVKDDHPLWQFFSGRKYMRTPDELSDVGEPWSIPQLRRKSFEDLHTLWYVCLKERNRLLREARIYEAWTRKTSGAGQNPFLQAEEKVKTSMWRIRHTLSERNHGFTNAANEFKTEYSKFLQEFEQEYLEADASADSFVEAKLERFQFAVFGINPLLQDNVPESNVVRGIKTVARLKLTRFAHEDGEVKDVQDINEAFLLFTCEHSPEGVQDAVSTIKEYRAKGVKIPASDDIPELARILHAFRSAA